ncbi:MAG TPA: geranylgeranyl reductase family protein [Syntrophobacteria bacterium]|nr:geranylgeranyl reductase family protein [Syntrophobacteria bacterium]
MAADLQTDVLVVGAGPAGAVAALELARQGIGVLLVDRSAFPREKTCGDALVEESLNILVAVGIGDFVRERGHRIDRLRFWAPNGREFHLGGDFATLRRRDLDALIVEEASRSGARFIGEVEVREPLVQGGTCVGARGTDRKGRTVTVAAKVVLLATGAGARVLAAFGVLQEKRPPAFGIRGYFRLPAVEDEKAMIFAYDRALLPGYAWFFPMGGGLFNVGWGIIGAPPGRIPKDRSQLTTVLPRSRQVARLFVGASQESPIRAAAMRTGCRGARACSAGLLVLGEAAGLTFPFLGEGISNALMSGRLAARVAGKALEAGDVSARFLTEYEREIRCRLHARHQGYLAAERWFRFPWVANLVIGRAAGTPALGRLTREILTGQRDARALFSVGGLLRVLLGRLGPRGGWQRTPVAKTP